MIYKNKKINICFEKSSKMEQTLIYSTNSAQMDLSIDEIDSTNPVEMDTSIDGIDPASNVQMDLSISEIEPNLDETDLLLTIEKTKIETEIETEITELISKIKEETILNIIEQCKILFEKNKSCENYNNILKVLNKTIKNRTYFDDDKVYSFQQFHISKFNIVDEFKNTAHIIFMMKNTAHRQAICMTILESIEIAPEIQTELLLIKQFIEDNIEYI